MISIPVLVHAVVILIVLGLVFGLLWYLIDYCAIPDPFGKVARVVLMVLAVLICIGVLLSLAGIQVFTW